MNYTLGIYRAVASVAALLIGIIVLVSVPTFADGYAVVPQCQYPDRPLIEGKCDNSDPCDPTTIDGKCKDDPTGKEYDPCWNKQTNKRECCL